MKKAITVMDGNALCSEHVILNIRKFTKRRIRSATK